MWSFTRADGLARLYAFAPGMGRAYAEGRNFDRGAGAQAGVSGLSPYIRRRLILEREVIACALAEAGPVGSEKFIQEVIWRGYFKGWLEQRPATWSDYRKGVLRDHEALAANPDLAARLRKAMAGETGIACFDAWAQELRETGYLHNHARMWFASIWIFTLGLPWRLGAEFFLFHLLDGDPASNTLSWRWVGGLHTPGKFYAARSDNIAKYTGGRFATTPGLAEPTDPVAGDPNPPPGPVRAPRPPDSAAPALLLVTEEDGCPETLAGLPPIAGVATVQLSDRRTMRGASALVRRADESALADAAMRFGHDARSLVAPNASQIASLARACGAQQVVTSYLSTGWVREWARDIETGLGVEGLGWGEIQRTWDSAIWPHATAGFFKVKKKIPEILREMDLLPESLPLFMRR